MSEQTIPERKKYDAKRIIKSALPTLILLLGIGTLLYYIIGPARGYMTSDTTDSLRWAYATYESGRLISGDFFYAAILPFGGNLIFLPFIAMFGYSMTSQILGLVTFVLLLAAALWYMARGLGLDLIPSASLTSIFLLIMSSSGKLREIMWEHIFYYNLGLLFFCLGFGLAARIVREGGLLRTGGRGGWRDYVNIALLLVFAFLAATDGLQTLVCFTLPLFFGLFIERFLDARDNLLSSGNMAMLTLLALLTAASAAGFMAIGPIRGDASAGYADAYSTWSAMSSWTGNSLGFMNNYFSLLGVSVEAGDTLVSLPSIINIIGIAGGLLLLTLPLILLLGYKKIANGRIKMILIGHMAVSAFILFAVIFGKLGGANWRLIPMLGTSVILSFITGVELIGRRGVAARIGSLVVAFLVLLAAIPALSIWSMPADYGRDNSWHTAADVLEERGLKYGYANFWWAESVSMFSDGKVQIANIGEGQPQPVRYNYQLPRSAFDDKPDAEHYFLMLTEAENARMEDWIKRQKAQERVIDEFTIVTEEYNLRGHVGTTLYVYVFSENIF